MKLHQNIDLKRTLPVLAGELWTGCPDQKEILLSSPPVTATEPSMLKYKSLMIDVCPFSNFASGVVEFSVTVKM
jgi:hypothetical protein